MQACAHCTVILPTVLASVCWTHPHLRAQSPASAPLAGPVIEADVNWVTLDMVRVVHSHTGRRKRRVNNATRALQLGNAHKHTHEWSLNWRIDVRDGPSLTVLLVVSPLPRSAHSRSGRLPLPGDCRATYARAHVHAIAWPTGHL